jgi:hypothetical protein
MQRLFCRILHFSLFLAFAVIVICVAVRCFLLRISEGKINAYRSASILILGDSHPAEALLTDSIDGSFGFAFGGESFPSGYTALKLFSEDSLENMRLVILGVSYHSFCRQDTSITPAFHYRMLFSLYPLTQKGIERIHQAGFPYGAIIEVWACYRLGFPSRNSIPELRQLMQKSSTSAEIAPIPIEWETRIDQQFYEKTSHRPLPPSHTDIDALRNIQTLCRRKGYSLVLYNAPVPRDYHENIPSFHKHLMDSVINSLVDNRTTFYIDHSQYPLPDNYFRDCDHVNIHGATIVTPLLRDNLRSLGLLPSDYAM